MHPLAVFLVAWLALSIMAAGFGFLFGGPQLAGRWFKAVGLFPLHLLVHAFAAVLGLDVKKKKK